MPDVAITLNRTDIGAAIEDALSAVALEPHSFIAAMAKRFPIDLAITVGHPAMIGTGPLGGHAVETGIVIASTDPLAADVVGAQLLGFSSQAVRHLWEAARLGLGESDLEKIQFPALSMKAAIERFTEAAYGERLTFEHA